MENIFFFQTQQIPVRNKSSHVASLRDSSSVFNQLKEQKIFYSYFQVDQNYYLFLFSQKSIDINFLYQLVEIIEELDSKQRKIRSLRGFFLYALEIMKTGKEYEILSTNLQPFFWKKVHNIIRQNKKSALQEFLFRKDQVNQDPNPRIKILEDQINFLQDRICDLETNSKYALKGTLDEPDEIKTIQQDDYTIDSNKGSYLQENHTGGNLDSNTLSEASKIYFKASETSEQYNKYNIPSNKKKSLNEQNFITLSKITEQERIEIIQTGFKLNQQGKISLKKYYESTEEYSLFQWKGYSIKYESIRRTKLYQS